MTREELGDKIIGRCDREYGNFTRCIESMYDTTVEKLGYYDEKIFAVTFCKTLHDTGAHPSIVTTLLYFARKHIEAIQNKEANNG